MLRGAHISFVSVIRFRCYSSMLSGAISGFSHTSGQNLGSPIPVSMVLEDMYSHYDTEKEKDLKNNITHIGVLS